MYGHRALGLLVILLDWLGALFVPADLLTIDETAHRLACSRRSVYRLIEDGRLRSMKVGGLRRVRDDEIERYLKAAGETL